MDLTDSIVLAAALHAGVLVASAWTIPALGETDSDLDRSTQHVFQLYVIPPAEPDEVELPEPTPGDGGPDARARNESRCGGHLGGSMGEPTAADDGHRYGVQGPADNPDPHVARLLAQNLAWTPSIGFTPQDWSGDPTAPIALWGRDDSFGNDAISARGNMWGAAAGPSLGSPGAGIGRKRICPTCGDDGRGVEVARTSGTTLGGATGTERAR